MTRDVRNVLERGLTVRQLLDEIEHMPDDTPVVFVCNYGDYHRTQQALPIGEIEEYSSDDLRTTAYSQSGISLVDDCDEDERTTNDDAIPVIVLQS